MTTRVLVRWVRLLAKRPQSAVAGCRLQSRPLLRGEPLLTWGWLHPQVRPLCKGHSLPKEEEYPAVPKETRLDELITNAKTAQDILQLWGKMQGSANQAASSLICLARLGAERAGGRPSDMLKEPGVQVMLDIVSTKVQLLSNSNLVFLLRTLSLLGVAPSAPLVHSLQLEVQWRARRLSYKQLAHLVDWGAGRTGQQHEAMMSVLLKELELRWTELADARSVSILISKVGHLSPTLTTKLEEKALELAERFTAEDIRRVALSLAFQGRRTVPLLRALSYHLQQKLSSELSTSLLIDMAFAYGKLNFHQTQVFQRITAELLTRMAEISAENVTRCAKSFAFLKWLNLPLFEAFTEHYMQNNVKYSTQQLCNLLMSMARLNFQPSKGEQFYQKVHGALGGALFDLEPFLQTDVVWSLCVLQQAKPEQLRAVTQPAFLAKLMGGNPSREENYHLKLLHVLATAQLEHLERGFSTDHFPFVPSAAYKGSDPSPLQSTLHLALKSLAGDRELAYRTGTSTVYGWTIDGELVVDTENKPIDLLALTAPHLPGGGGPNPLPQGGRRIAFLAREFPNYISRSKDLLGRYVMQRRHLQLAGFLTVEVPYYEWLELKTDWQKVAYLKDKLGKAVAEHMAK